MDTKSKKLTHSILIILGNFILFFCIIAVIQLTSFLQVYRGYDSFSSGSDNFMLSSGYNDVVQQMLYGIFEKPRLENSKFDISDLSSTAQVYAVDKNGKCIKQYSNVNRPWSPWDPLTGDDAAFSIVDNSDGDGPEYYKYYHESPLIGRDKVLLERFHFSLPYEAFKKSKISTISIKFNYIEDTGELGENYKLYTRILQFEALLKNMRLIAFSVGAVIGLIFIFTTGKRDQSLWWIDKIYTEIIVIIGGLGLAFLLELYYHIFDYDYFYHSRMIYEKSILQLVFLNETIICTLIAGMLFLLLFHIVLSLVRSLKRGEFLQRILGVKIIKLFFEFFKIKRLYNKAIILAFIGYTVANLFMMYMVTQSYDFEAFLWIMSIAVVDVYALNQLYQHLNSLKKLYDFSVNSCYSEHLAQLNEYQITPLFKDFAINLNNMSQGKSVAMEKAIKNERMRSQLITNVTHDLKNPLTSIISYSDLLKKENLDNQTAGDYVDVIYDKSLKLKDLIDHLVEASKVSSGVTEISVKPLDLVAMTKQIAGEYEEALNERGLKLVLSHSQLSIMVKTDATYYARILDNLFSNVVKYAMPGTRVYLEVDEAEGCPKLCLKNISETPLTMSGEELQERFTRGDTSRTKEGNGLGLSIAKSLAIALKIDFSISVDGDLFKVCMLHQDKY